METTEKIIRITVSEFIDKSREIEVECVGYNTDDNNNLKCYDEEGCVMMTIHVDHWFSVQ
jgi:hypothetical protein